MSPDPLAEVGLHAVALAGVFGLDPAALVEASPRLFPTGMPVVGPEVVALVEAVAEADAPHQLGAVLARTLAAVDRQRGGVVYTPRGVAEGLVGAALDDVPTATVHRWRAVDPACGGGAFLLAVADALLASGLEADEIVGEHLWGIDIDPLAVAAAEGSLALWAALRGGSRGPGAHLAVGDALLGFPSAWSPDDEPFDLVVGNPPFLGQLADATRDPAERRAALRSRWGDAVRPYADAASLFLVAGRRLAASGGRIVLVQPLSVLGSRDAAPARAAVLTGAHLRGLWLAADAVFDADVRTCAPVIAIEPAARDTVDRWSGAAVDPMPPAPSAGLGHSWAPLAADLLGVPSVVLARREREPRTVGDLARATAGFRDQFYGLAPYVREAEEDDDELAPLITSGLIDVGQSHWGRRVTRYAGRRWSRPAADLDALLAGDPALGRWFVDRQRPKVLVANQTKVIEAVVDLGGRWLPSVPVISVEPHDPADVWRVAAALLAPPVSASVFQQRAGSGLSAQAVRLSARSLADLPLPVDDVAWREAARHLERCRLDAFGPAATVAYGLAEDDPVVAWWLERAVRR